MREQGIISPLEQDLYMYLLHKCNILYWKNPFMQSTQIVCSVLNTNRSALIIRRKRLKQLGLIDYKEGQTKNRPAEYTIAGIDPTAKGKDREKKGNPSGSKKVKYNEKENKTTDERF